MTYSLEEPVLAMKSFDSGLWYYIKYKSKALNHDRKNII